MLRELFSTTAGSTEKRAQKVLPVCAIIGTKSTQRRVDSQSHHFTTIIRMAQTHSDTSD
jgi:hypothetical protein